MLITPGSYDLLEQFKWLAQFFYKMFWKLDNKQRNKFIFKNIIIKKILELCKENKIVRVFKIIMGKFDTVMTKVINLICRIFIFNNWELGNVFI